MSRLSGHKPKLSIFPKLRRASIFTVFAFSVLLAYALLPRRFPSSPRGDVPQGVFHGYDINQGQPTTANTSEYSIAETGQHSITDKEDAPHTLDTTRQEEIADATAQFTPGCLRRVFYDKPVKTGSTAITFAIRGYLKSTGRLDLPCNQFGDSCSHQVERVCKGVHKRQKEEPSFLGHFWANNASTVACLKRLGFYVVTSIRDPYQRRKSAYLYNKTVKGQHYSIPYTASFEEFMSRLPRCALYHYYDGLGRRCDGDVAVEERVRRIVERYDEVIELGHEVKGPLHRKIVGYIEKENESRREEIREKFDGGTLAEENLLYNALREKMLKGGSGRVPC